MSQKKQYKWRTDIRKKSTSLILREMPIKTSIIHHVISARMAMYQIRQTRINENVAKKEHWSSVGGYI